MRFALAIVILTAITGCGPMFLPMLPRLNPEDQQKVKKSYRLDCFYGS